MHCLIRKETVACTPEEQVRQAWLDILINKLQYPASIIAVEKALEQLPHLQGQAVPQRRADIICFGHNLEPLLLIECKAVPLTQKVIDQVVGYNYYLRSKYIAIANQTEVRTGWLDKETGCYKFEKGLPFYKDIFS